MICHFCDKPIEVEQVTIGSGEQFHPNCYTVSMEDKCLIQTLEDEN
jgi:hypothetical protein